MNSARYVAAVAITVAAILAIGFASRAPYTPQHADAATLRLSWRLRGEKQETCRNRTQAELDALPVHMRTPQICTGHVVSYRLIVSIDGAADTVIYKPAGAKGDRAIFVLLDKPLTHGPRGVAVSFEPTEVIDSSRVVPLHLEGRITAQPGRITLVTLDNIGKHLVIR